MSTDCQDELSACAEIAHRPSAHEGICLNPYYEIARDLRIEDAHWSTDFRPRILALAERRPELRPFPRLAITASKDSDPLSHYSLQSTFVKLFSFAIPTPEAITAIARLGSVVEIGAGTGYWSALVAGTGSRVRAFDDFSWELSPAWYPVERGGANSVAELEADVLLLCWPPYASDMAARALAAFQGRYVAYVGEGEGGCTGDDGFHEALERDWSCGTVIPLLQWPGLHDQLEIWGRRNDRTQLRERKP